jgi:hypothetical protein
MTWFRKQHPKPNPKEIARVVREKAEKWEREHQAEAEAINQEAQDLAAAEVEERERLDRLERECARQAEVTAAEEARQRIMAAGGSPDSMWLDRIGAEASQAGQPSAGLADQARLLNLPDLPPWDQPAELPANLVGEDLIDLLVSGGQLAEWFLEERSPSGVPGWCTRCWKRTGTDDGVGMYSWRKHAVWCLVGGWLRARARMGGHG